MRPKRIEGAEPMMTVAQTARLLRWVIQHADAPHVFALLRKRRERPGGRGTNNSLDEIASSHCRPQGSEPVRTMLWN